MLSQRTTSVGGLLTADTRLAKPAEHWLTGLETEGRIEETTINEYRRVLMKDVLPRVGGLRLREVSTGRLDRLLTALREESVNRQRKAKVVLGAMLDVAVRHDALAVNPVRGTSRIHTPKRETRALRIEDLAEIRAAVQKWLNSDRPGPKASADMADIIDLMLAAGCRIGEVLALRCSDLDLDGETATLTVTGTIKTEKGKGTYRKPTPKTDSSRRTVVLPAFAADLLRERREFAAHNDLDAVFATRNGTWRQVVNIERRWRQIRKDTGFEWVTPHTFRKTVATLISEASTSELASRTLVKPDHARSLHRQAGRGG